MPQPLHRLVLLAPVVASMVACATVPQGPTFVGRQRCASCHAEETRRWTGSPHDLAMQEATEGTVLGRFDGTSLTHGDVTTTFSRRDGDFVIRTDGPDGALHDYVVAYTFGVYPLQQYLIALPGGRLQATTVAWDARPAERGGQRWFSLHGSERIDRTDPLHWTQPSQNWNDRCARCHSTGVRKRYTAAADRYDTTWAEIDVACEACHGPGSAHVAWAEMPLPRDDDPRRGLTVPRADARAGRWVFSDPTGIARREPVRSSHAELDVCAPCHSRRADLADDAPTGRPLLDHYVPALLDEGLYFADGQIQDEVYEWGSFVQSRMFQAGVTCSDCHDPHGLGLRASGNAVCAQCHLPSRFDRPAHHFHPADSAGAQCVSCHMPARTYMGVDERHDHGFRVPRPDLAAALGAPDVCTGCHADRTPAWAADVIAQRSGPQRPRSPHWGEALAAGRRGAADAEPRLVALAQDQTAPDIVRATAIRLLGGRPGPIVLGALAAAAADASPPLLRFAAVDALEGHEPRVVAPIAARRLHDPLGTIRLWAARALAGAAAGLLAPEERAAVTRSLDAYRTLLLANADRPESYLNLALLDADTGTPGAAEAALRTAIRRWPYFRPAWVNLADTLRAQRRDAEGEAILRRALEVDAENDGAYHALGLLLVRRGQLSEALPALERAAALAPADARYAYVYGVALHTAGRPDDALATLRSAHERRPGEPTLLVALATISRDAGRRDDARRWAAALVALTPWDEAARRLRDELAAAP